MTNIYHLSFDQSHLIASLSLIVLQQIFTLLLSMAEADQCK